MRTWWHALVGILSLGALAIPLVDPAQPTIEDFRFDPPGLRFRNTFRWGFSHRGLTGGLAAVKAL